MDSNNCFGTRQVRRGDMGLVLLKALLSRPMHGYEIIRELEERSKGTWRPSPGSVYPTLQLLEEQDFVTSSQQKGKKVYTITKLGHEETVNKKPQAPSECSEIDLEKVAELRTATTQLMNLIQTITRTGSATNYKQAEQIIAKTSEKLSTILDKKDK